MRWHGLAGRIVDFHSHVIPGVDDGAQDTNQAVAALGALQDDGVGTVVATPHLDGSLTERPGLLESRLDQFDEAWASLQEAVEQSGLNVRLERGAEVRLDAPALNLSDPRVRLSGTKFVLVEFMSLRLPPYGSAQLAEVRTAGWLPVLAHPERYGGLAWSVEVAARWKESAYLQVNAGSLMGRYGPEARRVALELLERGWVDYLCSDYHARGKPLVAEARAIFSKGNEASRGPSVENVRNDTGDEWSEASDLSAIRLLTEVNPARLLEGRKPCPVPPWRWGWSLRDRLRRIFR